MDVLKLSIKVLKKKKKKGGRLQIFFAMNVGNFSHFVHFNIFKEIQYKSKVLNVIIFKARAEPLSVSGIFTHFIAHLQSTSLWKEFLSPCVSKFSDHTRRR